LKKGDWLFLSLFGDNPHNLHAVVIESEWLRKFLQLKCC
jgi:hypothetical protein